MLVLLYPHNSRDSVASCMQDFLSFIVLKKFFLFKWQTKILLNVYQEIHGMQICLSLGALKTEIVAWHV